MGNRVPDESDGLTGAIRALLREQFERSPALKVVASELARWVLAEYRSEPETRSRSEQLLDQAGALPEGAEATQDAVSEIPGTPEPETESSVVPLGIGDCRVDLVVSGSVAEVEAARQAADPAETSSSSPSPTRSEEIDLLLIAKRALLKARSCRLVVERNLAQANGDDDNSFHAKINTLIAEAKQLPECFLWVLWRRETQPDDDSLTLIASCYEGLAEITTLCATMDDPRCAWTDHERQMAFYCFAEVCSALRIMLDGTWLVKNSDADQSQAHIWLCDQTYQRQIYVARHMCLDDPANPERMSELIDEIRVIRSAQLERARQGTQINEIVKRIQYHADKCPEAGPADEHDFRKINEGLAELAALGLSSSDRRLQSIIERLSKSHFPDGADPHPWVVGTGGADETELGQGPESRVRVWSEQVNQVRELISGHVVVLFGGEPRNDAIARIKEAFDLKELIWVALSEHGSAQSLHAPISRPSTTMVLGLIKLAGHGHVSAAREIARQADKLFVALPAGYNPEQIAEAVMSQVGIHLAEATTPTK